MSKSPPVIIVDTSYLLHYMKYGMKDLSSEEQETGVIFGFLNKIISLGKNLKSNKFVFALDSRDSLRREIYPTYKKKRKDDLTEEEKELNAKTFAQGDLLTEEILPFLGFKNIYRQDFYEGDDIIGSCVLNNHDDIILVASDGDLHQLLSPTVRMYNVPKSKFFTQKDFREKWGIDSERWYDVKCIAGCKSDNVDGISGVGEKTAIKYLNGTLPSHHKTFQRIESEEGKRNIKQISPLVKVPMTGTKKIKLNFSDEQFSLSSFLEVCDKYEFHSFVKGYQFDTWRNIFVGRMKNEG